MPYKLTASAIKTVATNCDNIMNGNTTQIISNTITSSMFIMLYVVITIKDNNSSSNMEEPW